MATVNPLITVDVFEIDEFPEIRKEYRVIQVPKTFINEKIEFVGAAPEDFLVEKILSFNSGA